MYKESCLNLDYKQLPGSNGGDLFSSAIKMLFAPLYRLGCVYISDVIGLYKDQIESRHRVTTQWTYRYLTPAPFILLFNVILYTWGCLDNGEDKYSSGKLDSLRIAPGFNGA